MKPTAITGFTFLTAVSVAVLIILSSQAFAQNGLAVEGRALAEQHCSRCHVIGNYNRMGGISSTPSFYILVNGLSDWQDRFSNFYSRLPHPSVIRMEGDTPPKNYLPTSKIIKLQYKHVDAILVFVKTLKK
jgi:hypothetical protein